MIGLREIVLSSKALLLDFDGPVCRVFAGLSPSSVASELRRYLSDSGVDPPAGFEGDPLRLLAWVGEHHPDLSSAVDDRLRDAEALAVESAVPTSHVEDVMVVANRRGISVAIVSNNAREAIDRYLTLHHLDKCVAVVVGRLHGDPTRLKPHPYAVQTAVERLRLRPADCALVGDSPADIVASRAVGVHAIGYAKSADRRSGLIAAGAEAVVDSMGDIAGRLEPA